VSNEEFKEIITEGNAVEPVERGGVTATAGIDAGGDVMMMNYQEWLKWGERFEAANARIAELEAQLAEAKRLWEVADQDRVASRKIAKESAQRAGRAEKERDEANARAEAAEKQLADFERYLDKESAFLSKDDLVATLVERAEQAEARAAELAERCEKLEGQRDAYEGQAYEAHEKLVELGALMRKCEECDATMTHRGLGQWECWKCAEGEVREKWKQSRARAADLAKALEQVRNWTRFYMPLAEGTSWEKTLQEVSGFTEAALNPEAREEESYGEEALSREDKNYYLDKEKGDL
jgi:hypothetical protein